LFKLHIGCGWNVLPGWINVDIRPRYSSVIPIDVRRGLPFPDGIFDYVFHEHVIEHLDRTDGMKLLAECFRVLRPGGKMRVVAPDLDFLWKLMHEPTEMTRRYVKEQVANHLPGEEPHPTLIVNNFFRSFDHQFIYDVDFMCKTLERVGFGELRQGTVGASDDPNLDDLENVGRMPEGFLALESMVIEARKPEEFQNT
jgi:predicted SAM-dependent methyltransferase